MTRSNLSLPGALIIKSDAGHAQLPRRRVGRRRRTRVLSRSVYIQPLFHAGFGVGCRALTRPRLKIPLPLLLGQKRADLRLRHFVDRLDRADSVVGGDRRIAPHLADLRLPDHEQPVHFRRLLHIQIESLRERRLAEIQNGTLVIFDRPRLAAGLAMSAVPPMAEPDRANLL